MGAILPAISAVVQAAEVVGGIVIAIVAVLRAHEHIKSAVRMMRGK